MSEYVTSEVTLLLKNSTLVPSATNLAAGTVLPKLTLACQTPETSPLSSDQLSPPQVCEGDGMQFSKPLTLEHLERNSADSVTFTLTETGTKNALGKGLVRVSDLIKHAEFAAALKDQGLVFKHSAAPCPLRVEVSGKDALDGACLSIDLDILEGSKVEAAKMVSSGDSRHASIFLSAKSILATRGAKTDSFCRVMLVLDGGVEHEIGRTETVIDDLSPEFNAYVSLSYSVAAATQPDSKTLLRFEVCDPGTKVTRDSVSSALASPAKAASSKGDADNFTVIGACQRLLYEVHKMMEAGEGSGSAGLYRESYVLRQKGELQGLIKANEKEKADKYGSMFVVVERVKQSDECVSLIIGASKLYTNKLSMRPDPFVRIYRRLDAKSGNVEGMPTRCPVYASNWVRSTREASWSTTPIPMQLLSNSNPEARIIVEVWDFQFNAEDRLIGSVEMTVRQLLTSEHGDGPKDPKKQTYVKAHALVPPAFFAQTGSTVDRTASFLTGGVASKPGTFSVFTVKTFSSPDLATQHVDCFDVDTILREKKASQPLVWDGLHERRNKFQAKVRSGIVVMETSCGARMAKDYQHCSNQMATIGITKCIYKYAPFYQARKIIGAKFGSAFEAYFSFSYTLIRLNLFIALLWFVFVVLPQYSLMSPPPDLLYDLSVTFKLEEFAQAASSISALTDREDVDLSAVQAFYDSGNVTTFRPGVLIFSGYLPRFSLNRIGEFGLGEFGLGDRLYYLDFAYVCCILGTMSVSLLIVVCSLGAQVGAVRETGSAARTDGTGQVIDALFGGWDHLASTESAVRQTRYSLITQMKEGMGEAARAAERLARVKTSKERRNQLLLRFLAMSMSIFLVLLSVTTVAFVSSPEGVMYPDLRSYLEMGNTIVKVPGITPFHTLIVTLINLLSPPVIKFFVHLEQWESPETEIRQTLIRQICLKLANLIVLFLSQKTGSVYIIEDKASPTRCLEEEAAKNFIILLITDMVVSGIIMYIVKCFMYYPVHWCVGKPIGPFGKKGLVDLPTEIVNICYRQTMLLIGSLVSPWIFAVGMVSNTVLYFMKYLMISTLFRPPDRPFKASSIKKLFYAVLLVANVVGIVPIAMFLTSVNNPNCGPLRTYECAMEEAFGETHLFEVDFANHTACAYQYLNRRPNYASFTEVLLPVSISDLNPLEAVSSAVEGNSTALEKLATHSQCGSALSDIIVCWISVALTAIFSGISMMMAALLMCICLFFARKQARRLNTELDAANDECASEHHDKVKLLRYAGVSLD